MDCPDENTLQAFASAELRGDAATAIDVHIDACADCRRLVAALGRAGAPATGSNPRESRDGSHAPEVRQRVGRYILLEPLGAGATGVVYAALDPDLDRRVALKLLGTGRTGSSGSTRTRFMREAKAIARLSHPNVVAVYEVGTFGDGVFIAMELADGGNLREALAARPHSWRAVVELFLQAGEGVAAAHAVGIVHRDFKPDNVLVSKDGRVRVGDFGLARVLDDASAAPASARGATLFSLAASIDATLTQSGTLLGTPAYMPPEQLRGERADARSDQFAFSVALYEALYGARPFARSSVGAMIAAIERGEVADAPNGSAVPARIRAIVRRGLRASPDDRFPTMAEMLEALRAAAKPTRSRVRTALVLVAAAAALTVAGALALRARRASTILAASTLPFADAALSAPSFAFAPARVRRVTFAEGCEEYPVYTPDGEHVVFDATRGKDSVIAVLDLETGAQRDVTAVHGWDYAADVSPDGKRVTFVRSADGKVGAWVAGLDGTDAPRPVARGRVRPSFTPDGASIWAGDPTRPARYDIATGEEQRSVEAPPKYLGLQVREIADGRVLVGFPFTAGAPSGGVGAYTREGALTWLAQGEMGEVLALTPDGHHVLAVRNTPTHEPELLALSLDGEPTTSLMKSGVLPRKGLRFSPNGRDVVFSTCRAVRSIGRVEPSGKIVTLNGAADWEDLEASWVPETRRLVVRSFRDGTMMPWLIDLEGRAPPQRLSVPEDALLRGIDVASDGTVVVGLVDRGLFELRLDGGPLRPIVEGNADTEPAWRRGGRELLFTRQLADKTPQVFVVGRDGGAAHPLLDAGSASPAASPVDDRVAYLTGVSEKARRPMIFDPRTTKSAPLSDALKEGSYEALRFSPDGRRVAVVMGAGVIVEVDTARGTVLRRIDGSADTIYAAFYAGEEMLVIRAQWVGDLFIADGPF